MLEFDGHGSDIPENGILDGLVKGVGWNPTVPTVAGKT